MPILPSLTVGAMVSTVALALSAMVVLPPAFVAVTLILRLVASITPAVKVYVAVQVPLPFDATTAAPPPN
ncbi:hypothetical protein D3C81_1218950 [compost metagenome]